MTDVSKIPAQRAGVRFEELDGEAVVYDRVGKRATYLNDTAVVIWKLCDGTRTISDIIGMLSKEYPEAAASIDSDVKATIDRLVTERTLLLSQQPKTL